VPTLVALDLLPCRGSHVLLPALEANLLYRYDTRWVLPALVAHMCTVRKKANRQHILSGRSSL
jgi:hypothetical protein